MPELMRNSLLALILSLSTNAAADWLSKAGNHSRTAESRAANSPQVLADDQNIGQFVGLVPTKRLDEGYTNAFLAALPSGYLLPLTPDGELAGFKDSYYLSNDCSGEPYLNPRQDQPVLAPTPGLIYRSNQSHQVFFIPRDSQTEHIDVRSVFRLINGQAVCQSFDQRLALLPGFSNNALETGYIDSPPYRRVSISMESPRRQPGGTRTIRQQLFNQDGRGSKPFEPEYETPAVCAPGCPVDAVGNGICEIECYNSTCSYDNQDCDDRKPEELEKALAEFCEPGCHQDDVGDGFCDQYCNFASCDFDGGDCQAINPSQ